MADYVVTLGKHATLVADEVDRVIWPYSAQEVDIVNLGSAAIYVRIDGNDPEVMGDDTTILRAGEAVSINSGGKPFADVRLISADTVEYHVQQGTTNRRAIAGAGGGGGGGSTDVSALARETTLQAVRDRSSFPLPDEQIEALKVISGEVSLDAATRAALEEIIVSGSVSLTQGSLDALESITVVGTVDLSPTALVALETISTLVTNWPTDFDVSDRPDRELGHVIVDNPPTNPETGLATEDTLATILTALLLRYGGGHEPVTATVTSAGDTTIFTPATGNRVRLLWISAINDPDQESSPLITVSLGDREVYRAFALAHWEEVIGEVDASLIVNLGSSGAVAVSATVDEITP